MLSNDEQKEKFTADMFIIHCLLQENHKFTFDLVKCQELCLSNVLEARLFGSGGFKSGSVDDEMYALTNVIFFF